MQDMSDTAMEVITVLEYTDNSICYKIPDRFINELKKLAETSNKKIEIDETRSLNEQKISEESKDLLALIYYSYIADEEEKKKIVKKWNENEKAYIQELENKYNVDNIFKTKEKDEQNALIEMPKEKSIFDRIQAFIKKILNKIR